MLIANVAGEIDIAPRWSFALPVYWSGVNYFTSTLKFRTFTLLPEVRYWFSRRNQGWFLGVHAGFAYYNVALGGEHRYQDHLRDRPAYGAGMSAGFRFPVGRSGRWFMEGSLGTGVYSLRYDIFQNRHNGALIGSRNRTFFGIDTASLAVCYHFDTKGGSR